MRVPVVLQPEKCLGGLHRRLALILVGGGLVRPPGAPLHAWFGLFQWVLLAVWLPCTIVLALRLLRLARAADVPR